MQSTAECDIRIADLSLCLSVWQSVCLPVSSLCWPVCVSVCVSVSDHLYVHLFL